MSESTSLHRVVAGITAVTLVSRITGAARVLVVTFVLGATFLGNTYQTANTIPNVIFELLVSGALTAILVPSFVRSQQKDSGQPEGEDCQQEVQLANEVVGYALLLLGVAAVGVVLLRSALFEAAFAGTRDLTLRHQQVELASSFLLFFAPQVLFYVVGAVSAALLNSRNRFMAAVLAPIGNNVIVIGCYLAFWQMHDHSGANLVLSSGERWVLGGGTTLGVIALAAIPATVLWASGTLIKPTLRIRSGRFARLVRDSAWATLLVGSMQLFTVVAVRLANNAEGGVVAFTLGTTILAMPVSLLAIPVITGALPQLARSHRDDNPEEFTSLFVSSLRLVTFLSVPATIMLVVLRLEVADVLTFGSSQRNAAAQTAEFLGWAGVSLLLTGLATLASRALLASARTRAAAVVTCAAAVAGVLVALIGDGGTGESLRAIGLGTAGLAFVQCAGCFALLPWKAKFWAALQLHVRWVLAVALAALVSSILMVRIHDTLTNTHTVSQSLVAIAAVGVSGLACYLTVAWLVIGSAYPMRNFMSGRAKANV